MHRDWLAMEHYRLHVMEQWPDSPRKTSAIAAVKATLESLKLMVPEGTEPFECLICNSSKIIAFPVSAGSSVPFTKAA